MKICTMMVKEVGSNESAVICLRNRPTIDEILPLYNLGFCGNAKDVDNYRVQCLCSFEDNATYLVQSDALLLHIFIDEQEIYEN